jgi:hypothetical protein
VGERDRSQNEDIERAGEALKKDKALRDRLRELDEALAQKVDERRAERARPEHDEDA